MKIWIKFLIGIVIGILLALFVPPRIGSEIFDYLAQLFYHIGRYIVFPLVFFSLLIGTHELRESRKIGRTYGLAFLFMILSTFLLTLIGVLSVFLFSPERIPIQQEIVEEITVPGVKETILSVFPKNLFDAFTGQGDILLPLIVLAFIIGVNLHFDKSEIKDKPLIQLADSASRLFYHINTLVAEVFGIALIAITASSIIRLQPAFVSPYFQQMIIILVVDAVVVLFGIIPGFLYLLGDRENPYKWIYAITGPLLMAFATGDEYLSLSSLIKHGRENLGISRKTGSAVFPLLTIFGKAGTAMVTSVSFIIILKSFSTIDINPQQVLWVIGASFLVSFTLSSVPGVGAFVAIQLMCQQYGQGFEDAYVRLADIKPLLISFAVVLDVAINAFTAFLIEFQNKNMVKKHITDFI
ncbi:MAG: dicarboxylate/amino acid:cation symporter [Spirochaetales bacterium]|nr:dicarboxylate/amino acid:cation symporter [Spirochaetales bacterium]